MENICPICNEIKEIKYTCNKCGNHLIDKGRVQEYLDDYSADMPIQDYKNYCVHIFYCNVCGNKEIKYIEKVII